MRIFSRIKKAVQEFFSPAIEVDVLPSIDYSIEDNNVLDQKTVIWFAYYKGAPIFKGKIVPFFFSKDSALEFCWKHWKQNKPKKSIIKPYETEHFSKKVRTEKVLSAI